MKNKPPHDPSEKDYDYLQKSDFICQRNQEYWPAPYRMEKIKYVHSPKNPKLIKSQTIDVSLPTKYSRKRSIINPYLTHKEQPAIHMIRRGTISPGKLNELYQHLNDNPVFFFGNLIKKARSRFKADARK